MYTQYTQYTHTCMYVDMYMYARACLATTSTYYTNPTYPKQKFDQIRLDRSN